MSVESLKTKTDIGKFGPEYIGLESIAAPAEQLLIPADRLVMLSQIRSGHNPQYEQLKDSIRQNGLQSEISVARMESAEFEEYISFTNVLWGSSHEITSFQQSADGYHYLVIAGHSRTKAIQEISEEDGKTYGVPSKVYEIKSPHEIISHQLDENIHSRPTPEREAMAIVESYYYGIRQGLWANKKEFIASSHNKLSKYALDRALVFTELPASIRQFVLDGALPYAVGIELGKAARVARSYFADKYNANSEQVEPAVQDWLQLMITRVHNSKELSKASTKAQKFIASSAEALEISLAQHHEAGIQKLFELSLIEEARPIQQELQQRISSLGAEPLRDLATIISLHFDMRSPQEKAKIKRQIREAADNVTSYLGKTGIDNKGNIENLHIDRVA